MNNFRKYLTIYFFLFVPFVSHAGTLVKLNEFKRSAISDLSVAGLNYGLSALYAVSVKDSSGKLKIFIWANDETEPRANASAGVIKAVSSMGIDNKRLITALVDSQNLLKIIVWQISVDGRSISRLGSYTGPSITDVDVTSSWLPGTFFVAARLTNGKLWTADFGVSGNSVTLSSQSTHGAVDSVSTGSDLGLYPVAVKTASGLKIINFWSGDYRGGSGTGGWSRMLKLVMVWQIKKNLSLFLTTTDQ